MLNVLKSVSKHSIIYAIGDFASKGIAFFMIPLYTHYLGTDEYGVMEMLDLTTYIAGMIVGMGLAQAVVRFYYEYSEKSDRDHVISNAMLFIWGTSAIALPVLLFFASNISTLILDSPQYSTFFVIVFISTVIGLSNEIPSSVMRILEQSTLYISVSMCKLVVSLTLTILFVAHYEMGVLGVLLSGLISGSLLAVFLLFYILRQIKLSWSTRVFKAMIRYSFPMAWTWIGMFAMHYGDRFLLQKLAGLDSVGIYSLAYKFGMLTNVLVLSPFLMTWWPKQFEIVNNENAKDTYAHIFTYFISTMVFCSLGISILIKDVLSIIADPAYFSAYKYVPVLLSAYIFNGTMIFVQFGIHLKKKTKYLGFITIVIAIINIGLNIVLVPRLDVWGSTIATVISFFLLVVTIYPIAQHYYRIPYQFVRLAKLILTAAALYWLSTLIDFGSAIPNIVVKLFVALSFPAVLWLVRFYRPVELIKAREILVEAWRLAKRKLNSADKAEF